MGSAFSVVLAGGARGIGPRRMQQHRRQARGGARRKAAPPRGRAAVNTPRTGPSRWSPTRVTATPSGTSSRTAPSRRRSRTTSSSSTRTATRPSSRPSSWTSAIDKKVDGIIVTLAKPDAMKDALAKRPQGRHPGDHRELRLRGSPRRSARSPTSDRTRPSPARPSATSSNKRGRKKALCVLHEQGNVGHEQRCAGAKKTFDGTMREPVRQRHRHAGRPGVHRAPSSRPTRVHRRGRHPRRAVRRHRRQGRSRTRAARPRSTPSTSTPRWRLVSKDGTLGFAVDQQPYLQGYEAVDLLWLHKYNADVLGGGRPS